MHIPHELRCKMLNKILVNWIQQYEWVKSLSQSDSLPPHGLQPTRLLHPWDFPGKNTGQGCHFFLQEIFLTQGLNPGLPHCRQMLYHLSNQGSPSNSIEEEYTVTNNTPWLIPGMQGYFLLENVIHSNSLKKENHVNNNNWCRQSIHLWQKPSKQE